VQLAQQRLLLYSASNAPMIKADRGGLQLYVCSTASVLMSHLLMRV